MKELGRVVTGKTPPKNEPHYFDGEELFVSPKDLDWDQLYVTETETRVSIKALDKFRNQVIPKNSVMFTSLSFAFGKIGIASRASLTNQQINSLVVNKENDFRFIYYLLKACTPFIFTFNSGIDTPIVPKSVFERIALKCPEIRYQRKIAAVLWAHDELIENNKRRIGLLETLAEEIYREWFVRLRFTGHEKVKKLKGVPIGWRTLRFSEFCEFQKGKTPDEHFSDSQDGSLPYINVEFLEGQNVEYVLQKRNSIVCQDGDVLMLMDGARSGLVFRGKKGIVGSTFARVAMKPLHRDLVFEFLRASREHIVSNNTGSAIPHANKEFIHRLIVFLPPDDLIAEFNSRYRSLLDQTLNLQKQNEILLNSRDMLLSRLISGKLSVENLDIQFPPGMAEELKAASTTTPYA